MVKNDIVNFVGKDSVFEELIENLKKDKEVLINGANKNGLVIELVSDKIRDDCVSVSLKLNIHVCENDGVKSYWAECVDLDGLIVSGSNFENLKSEIILAASELLRLSSNTL